MFLHLVMQQAPAAQRLAIKSPAHSFRIKAIERIFPNGRYLWITRSPEEMLYSNRKMWHAMFKRYGLSECSTEKLDRFLLRAFTQAASCLDWLCQQVGRDKLAVIDFSQLTADPAGIVAAAGEQLGLGKEAELHAACEAAKRNRTDYQREQYPSQPLSPSMERAFRILDDCQSRALASHGV